MTLLSIAQCHKTQRTENFCSESDHAIDSLTGLDTNRPFFGVQAPNKVRLLWADLFCKKALLQLNHSMPPEAHINEYLAKSSTMSLVCTECLPTLAGS